MEQVLKTTDILEALRDHTGAIPADQADAILITRIFNEYKIKRRYAMEFYATMGAIEGILPQLDVVPTKRITKRQIDPVITALKKLQKSPWGGLVEYTKQLESIEPADHVQYFEQYRGELKRVTSSIEHMMDMVENAKRDAKSKKSKRPPTAIIKVKIALISELLLFWRDILQRDIDGTFDGKTAASTTPVFVDSFFSKKEPRACEGLSYSYPLAVKAIANRKYSEN